MYAAVSQDVLQVLWNLTMTKILPVKGWKAKDFFLKLAVYSIE